MTLFGVFAGLNNYRFLTFRGVSWANELPALPIDESRLIMKSAAFATVDEQPLRAERRNFQRVKVSIYGRFMLEDRSEHPCQVVDMSPGSAALRTDCNGELGERIVAYIDHIGRVEGVITRVSQDGFAMALIATDRKKDKLAAQLTWLANKHELDLPEDRRHERITPREPHAMLSLMNGQAIKCRLLDLSLSGAAVETDFELEIGTQVMLGTMRGIVVRQFDEGVAIEFAVVQNEDSLHSALGSNNNPSAEN